MTMNQRQLSYLIFEMKNSFLAGENVMAKARAILSKGLVNSENATIATLIAYDLQAGSYVAETLKNPARKDRWCEQAASLIETQISDRDSILEIGVGEGTTLSGVLKYLKKDLSAYGMDISWSRLAVANEWLSENLLSARLFVGDLLNIPLADNSVDVIYSSHSLEPNGGNERQAIMECLRVSRKAVVLIEPIFELANYKAQERMKSHGYVRNLYLTAESLGVEIIDYKLLEFTANPLNPSGVLILRKLVKEAIRNGDEVEKNWKCPLTGGALKPGGDVFFAPDQGIAYPVLRDIPLLRVEHAIVASKLSDRT